MRNGYFRVFPILLFIFVCLDLSAQKTLRLINRGKYEKAEAISLKHLNDIKDYTDITQDTKYPLKQLAKKVSAYHALGNIARIKGDFAAAELNYKKSDHIYKILVQKITEKGAPNFGDRVIKNTILATLIKSRQDQRHYARRSAVASIYTRLGELGIAKKILDSTFNAMKVTYGEKTSMARTAYATYGEYFMEQELFDSSRYYYSKYILSLRSDPGYFDLSLKKLSDAYTGLAIAHIGMKDIPNAIVAGKKANKLGRHRFVRATDGKNYFGKISTANLLAESYRLNNRYDKALKWNNKAFNLFNKQVKIITPEKLPVLATRGQIYWALQDTTAANSCFREMMQIFFSYTQNNFSYLSESERAYFYRKNKHFLELAKGYYHYLYFTKNYKQNYILRQLYEIHLNNKGVLLSSSSKLLNIVFAKNDAYLMQQYVEIRNLKESKNKAIESGKIDQLQAIQEEINRKEKQLRSTLSLETEKYYYTTDIVKSLPDSTTFIDILKCQTFNLTATGGTSAISATGEKYLYFILNNNQQPVLVENSLGANELEKRYYRAYINLAKSDLVDARVYQGFIEPMEQHLRHRKVIFSPDGIYNLINPEIIFDGKDYLINKYDFQSVVSAKDLSKLEKTKPVLKDITLIGWPDYTTHLKMYASGPVDLPGTAREITQITRVVDESMLHHTYTREDANEMILKDLPSTAILHFATHGFFQTIEAKDPMYTSGLILAITDSIQNNEDGYLTAYEASNLDLKKTFLVVLSACETGQGEFEEGEGVWGLQRAFQVAGVRYIIMSLFKVDDDVTALLMQEFYQNIVRGDSVLPAFRKAQMFVKQSYPLPVQWGAFVIKGF